MVNFFRMARWRDSSGGRAPTTQWVVGGVRVKNLVELRHLPGAQNRCQARSASHGSLNMETSGPEGFPASLWASVLSSHSHHLLLITCTHVSPNGCFLLVKPALRGPNQKMPLLFKRLSYTFCNEVWSPALVRGFFKGCSSFGILPEP